MSLFKKTILILACLFVIVQCDLYDENTQSQKDILKLLTKNFEEYPVYYLTLEKERVEGYLQDGLTIKDIAFLSAPEDSLYKYFNKNVASLLVEKVHKYNQVQITTEDINGYPVVNEEDIPEFIINREAPPFNYSGFTNVNYLSTPIISSNRAIVFHDSYGGVDIGITIHFFIQDDSSSWRLVNSGVL